MFVQLLHSLEELPSGYGVFQQLLGTFQAYLCLSFLCLSKRVSCQIPPILAGLALLLRVYYQTPARVMRRKAYVAGVLWERGDATVNVSLVA